MKKRPPEKRDFIERAGKNHPLKTMVYFILAGITMLFFTLMALFASNDPAAVLAGRSFPKIFFLSTALIIAGSFTIEKAWRAFKKDDGKKLLDYLMITLGLAVGFSVSQAYGWLQLWDAHITIFSVRGAHGDVKTSNGAFLFVISGLHLLHLAVGLFFLFLAMFKAVNVRGDDVRAVIYFSDKLERARVEMLAKYWHFLGGLWVLLFLFFIWFFV